MFKDLGTVKPGTTLYVPFHTFDSNDPSTSVTLTGLAVGDIKIFKDGGATERASTAGFTLLDTDGIDFSGEVGIHGVSIDLADNTTANFYEAGSQYWIVIGDVTVDGAAIRFIAATFRIGYEGAILDTTIATLASQTSFTLEEGSADNDAYNGYTAVVHDLASAVQVATGFVSDYTGSSKTVTLAADPGIFTMAAGDNISFFPPVQVASWNNVPLATTNPLPNAAPDSSGGLATEDASGHLAVDVREWLGTAVTTSATTTKPEVDVNSVSDDATAANNLELDYDGTGYNKSNSTIGTTTTNTDMRGTDNAALASVLGALTDAAAAGDPTTADTVMQYVKQLVNVLVGTTGVTTFPAAAAPANNVSLAEIVRAIYDDTNSLEGTKVPDTLSLANINAEVDTALNTAIPGSPTAGSVNDVLKDLDARLPGSGTLSTLAGSDINTEVADVIKTDTYTLPGQGAPTATPTLEEAIMYLYKAFRNRVTQTSTTYSLYADDESTVDQKATVSDDGTTFTRQELITGA